jgi:hypothetical protein
MGRGTKERRKKKQPRLAKGNICVLEALLFCAVGLARGAVVDRRSPSASFPEAPTLGLMVMGHVPLCYLLVHVRVRPTELPREGGEVF